MERKFKKSYPNDPPTIWVPHSVLMTDFGFAVRYSLLGARYSILEFPLELGKRQEGEE